MAAFEIHEGDGSAISLFCFSLGLERRNMSVILETGRLLLRPPKAADISQFVPLLDDYDVSKNLSRVPHPYTEDDGCGFIIIVANGWGTRKDFMFGILLKEDSAYIGTCGVHPSRDWEFGYWLGRPYWGHGYATEAVVRLIRFAFEDLGAQRLTAGWFADNPASGRVLEKLGCEPDGEEERASLSRGCKVICHKVVLTRAAFERRSELK
jgi:ribosomal-protein-alanine N-acetyltransferase